VKLIKLTALIGAANLALLASPRAGAHCDGLDGPVVKAAEAALEKGDVNSVLIWVQENDEPEIRAAFDQTLRVRKLNSEARHLADRFFFETLVRVHRAGEGAPYTGLKPAGRDLGPAIPAADKALREDAVEPLIKQLTERISHEIRAHFKDAQEKSKYPKGDLEAGREFVAAYVKYIHCVEALFQQATKDIHGHFDDHAKGTTHHEY
jgi:hypothetical protein